jgi:hypothetical protein
MGTKMDALVLEDTILLKAEQPQANGVDTETYKASFHLD